MGDQLTLDTMSKTLFVSTGATDYELDQEVWTVKVSANLGNESLQLTAAIEFVIPSRTEEVDFTQVQGQTD